MENESLFSIGGQKSQVLSYINEQSEAGWSDELSFFHEDNAGNDHFIDRASRKHAIGQINSVSPNTNGKVILEIGSSSGFMLKELHTHFPGALVIGSDVVKKTAGKSGERKILASRCFISIFYRVPWMIIQSISPFC